MSKTILITGTSSGFGKATALALAKKGYTVIAAMRHLKTKNAAVAEELRAEENIHIVEMDVTVTKSVNIAIDEAIQKYGKIDVLINNAGISGFGLLEATSIEQMKNIFETNVWGTMRNILAVLPSMREHRSGLIINFSSVFGLFSVPYLGVYTGSKYAIEGLTEALGYELKDYGIETITINPGPFPTSIANNPQNGANRSEITASYGPEAAEKIQRFGGVLFEKIEQNKMNPQEVADAIVQLIESEPHKRPVKTIVNRVTDNFEQKVADKKLLDNQEWLSRMGWTELI